MPTLQAFEEEPYKPDVKELIKKLSVRDKEEARIAALKIQALGREAMQELLEAIGEEEKKRRKRRVALLWAGGAYATLMLAIAVATRNWGMIGSIGSCSSIFVAAYAVSKHQANLARQLTHFNDVQVVGWLAEALEYNHKEVQEQAAEALVRLLPQMKASDSDLLNEKQRQCLYRVLHKAKKRPRLASAILKAFEQVGDAAAYPHVQELLDDPTNEPFAFYETAQECLPCLKERVDQEQYRQTLLRAAENTISSPETLLRPATSSLPEIAPEQLLRPGLTNHNGNAA